jgi:hypothetical protein
MSNFSTIVSSVCFQEELPLHSKAGLGAQSRHTLERRSFAAPAQTPRRTTETLPDYPPAPSGHSRRVVYRSTAP